MSCIAIAEMSCGQIKNSNEQRDKHIRFIALARSFIDGPHDVCRIALVGRDGTDPCVYDSHEYGSRHALAADVANTEEQFFVADKIVIQITADFSRWQQESVDVNIIPFGWHLLRQHLHLDIAGNMQLIVNTVLFLLGLLQLAVVLDEIPDNESQHDKTC